ncbi:magnesium transporter [Anaerocolumna cellulosilytica]|uniref:Magnesium transporter n=1 Tax=Anaerocolumna cellulosilytica TaxID=433286 RepID=A0A6S6R907_9FIRM|nr:MgtC/SapB family protein [Anaerocolumna cellulosilytica]MBB5195357.1 putative Mg2+ transporter-C (MgtC) family protein [Anaerocolumna cellulosilytica]BCJ95890.1 magnesium transporter [Anaerocolumna cellulosilytica]
MENFIRELKEINNLSIIVRLTLATLCGGLIGYDRSRKRRPAGFRTHILVCIGSTLVMITSQYINDIMGYGSDPTRLGAQVISGIGFLGAGTILITGKQQVKGLTTAAGLWASACMGLAIGIGFYEGAIIGCSFILGSMTLLHRFDNYVMSKTKLMEIYVQLSSVKGVSLVFDSIRSNNMEITNVDMVKNRDSEDMIGLFITIKQKEKHDHEKILSLLGTIKEVASVEEL